MKKTIKIFLACLTILSAVSFSGIMVSAETRHPHPTYKDTWNFGVTPDGWAYSHYYLEAPINLGSSASVTDVFGRIKSSARADYGWAYAGAKKEWSWVRAQAYYGWYEF